MGLILWIDGNTFATELIEKVFKKKKLEFYSLPVASDFAYLISDLNPEVLVLDAQTALNALNEVKLQYEKTSGFYGKPVIILNPRAGLDFIKNQIGVLNRPLDPFDMDSKIKKMLNSIKES